MLLKTKKVCVTNMLEVEMKGTAAKATMRRCRIHHSQYIPSLQAAIDLNFSLTPSGDRLLKCFLDKSVPGDKFAVVLNTQWVNFRSEQAQFIFVKGRAGAYYESHDIKIGAVWGPQGGVPAPAQDKKCSSCIVLFTAWANFQSE